MSSAALDAALAEIDAVYRAFTSPAETGCGYCHAPEETAYLRTPDVPIPVETVRYHLFEVPDHFDDHAAAIEAFLRAWWQDALAAPEPPYGIDAIFDTCVTIARTVTPFLEGWAPGPVADAHLARCADVWLYDLLSDDSLFSWWYDDTVDAAVTDLRAWLSGPGAARLHAAGEYDLATRVELLGRPHGERWDHPNWTSPAATN